MPTFRDLWERASRAPARLPTVVPFTGDRVAGSVGPRAELRARHHYFQLRVNELFLAYERNWFTEYDPLVWVLSEFQYANAREVVPFVLGPDLIAADGGPPKGDVGYVFTDTSVVGPHPFAGGSIGIGVVLCRLERKNYARELLNVAEGLAGAFDIATAVAPYLKVAGVVLDTLGALTTGKGTEVLARHRTEFDPKDGIQTPQFVALLARSDVDPSTLWVRDRRLVQGPSAETGTPYRSGDFVLYSLLASESRDDVDTLPFARLRDQLMREAQRSINDELWARARAQLFTLAEELEASPDLLTSQADALVAEYADRAVALRDRSRNLANLGPAAALDDRERRTTALLAL